MISVELLIAIHIADILPFSTRSFSFLYAPFRIRSISLHWYNKTFLFYSRNQMKAMHGSYNY